MKLPRLFPLLALLLVSGLASAQEAPAEPAQAPAGSLTPPPLVVAPDEDVPPPPPDVPSEGEVPTRTSVTAEALPSVKAAPAKDPVPRVAVEVLGGAAGGVVGATILGSVGYLLGSATVGCDECLVMAVAGAAAGGIIGIPVGTYAGGRFMGGRGRVGATVAGSMVGWGATFLALTLVNSGGTEAPPAVNAALFILPVVGASAGFELSHGNALRQEAEARASTPSVHLMPVATYSSKGPHLGLMGSF
ncbi:GlsB/YeaQ/YmgE family stress response membrane protein [Corallococcus carmarthensis]|uniref:GlsB/YeaQ/YmgE family stress response membrane protein n=1 Tax=Corallococcus carmarthensis TaxID=2316728 RepID=A0A3A8K753_9BACT|nr:GlsB/YeaQ/YmgE family stress response membrane protein [Corallococcus carmarthensis]RKH00175.1 GlsB/YeaQ/YmgE family stress response membrane protein [Corallococcus carmarthensis]